MQFTGFVRGTRATALPDPLFGLLLEQIQDLAELKVVLRGVWLRNLKKGAFRPVCLQEFLSDPVLLRGLAGGEASPEQQILRGLALAVQHQVFLYCPAGVSQFPAANAHDECFLLNTQEDREALAQQGMKVSADFQPEVKSRASGAEPPAAVRPNIFALYEDNIGTIGPLVAGQLTAVEEEYPAGWIAEAFDIAVARNARNLAYIEAILRRWDAEGKDHGELGRHSPPDNYQKHLKDYQRRWGISADQGA
ncbi:MAG: DnaD domain protein [Dehalococcoidia bacterium]|nr:DnaD domain protein [Dehalococcoidia bacterium]MSQ16649.1 DnaD domain protein [Dehalococcoidia bacterium]